jgi:hypothetical protein
MKIEFSQHELNTNGFVNMEEREVYFSQQGQLYTLAPIDQKQIARGLIEFCFDTEFTFNESQFIWVVSDVYDHEYLLVITNAGCTRDWYMATRIQTEFWGYEGI